MALKLGFVGVGGIARRHLTAAKARDDVEIVGHCDVIAARAKDAAEKFGGTAHAAAVELYDAAKPDAVVICTPPFAHGDIEEEACKRGIHFFVEKPVAINMDMAARVLRAVRESGVTVQVGYMFRLSEPLKKVREMLADRAVAMVQAHYYMPGLPSPSWWPKMDLGGGQLIEQATHMLDLGRFLAGDVKTVAGQTARVRDWTPPPDYEPGPGLLKYAEGFEIPDTTALFMTYESGALGTLSCSMVPQAKWDNGFKVVAEGLLVTIDGPNASWASVDGEGEARAPDDWANAVLYEFLDAIQGKGEVSVPYVEGVKSLAVSVAGYESEKRGGGPVEL
ncbi:MAG: Gfo/Idh/MocA family protein, partial [Armatimonadota bacterium]